METALRDWSTSAMQRGFLRVERLPLPPSIRIGRCHVQSRWE